MVVIDKLIKNTHFILFIEIYDIKELKYFYINKIIKY